MKLQERSKLLSRLCQACAERPVPRLVTITDDDYDRSCCIKTLSCLWSDSKVPDDIPYDELRIRSALIWLTNEEFRFAFFRLMMVGIGRSSEAAIWAVVEFAAEPVPKGSCTPPKRFAAFSRSDIQLTSDVINDFVADIDTQELSDTARRICSRSQRNWTLFSQTNQ